ncbi:hypothetical protein NIES4101_27810 (plasmid) [Calothrix sp. NIES-4101]|nr:hypothetical protein NIES4101_27810 [Calothrix sp. NIES-4101]
MKKSIKSALSDSLKAESDSVAERFKKADSVFLNKETEKNSEHSASEPPLESSRKVVRDSFTFPLEDVELIRNLMSRCLGSALSTNKSEIIRAGLHALKNMTDAQLVQAVGSLEKVKTGRPSRK